MALRITPSEALNRILVESQLAGMGGGDYWWAGDGGTVEALMPE